MERKDAVKNGSLFLQEVKKMSGGDDVSLSAVVIKFLDLYSENRIDLVPNVGGFVITSRKMTTGKGTNVFVPYPFEDFCSDVEALKRQISVAVANVIIVEEHLVGEERSKLETFKETVLNK
ncbi:MAG: hypothetical protein AAB656_01985 [Patescibacteria group bacterium]